MPVSMTTRKTRNVSLTPELETFIAQRLTSGDFGNASEVVRSALKLLRDQGERPKAQVGAGWLVGGGECGDLIRGRDWGRTALGPVSDWSPELRATVANIVNSPIPKVLMWGSQHVMLYNDAYTQIAGPRHPQALGGTVPEIWPEIWNWNRRVLEAGFRGEVMSYRDQPMTLTRTGLPEEVMFDLFYTPVYEGTSVGGVMCTVLEETARFTVQRDLARSESELRVLADAVPALVAFIDRDHVYRFANRQYENWFGLRSEEIIGRSISNILGEAAYRDRIPLIERVLKGEAIIIDAIMPHKDGRERRCETHYLPRTDENGAITGFQAIVFDVEERYRHLDAVALSNGRFRTAMDAVHGVLWTNSPEGRMLGEQPGWEALTGQTQAQYQDYGWADAVHPDDRQPSIDSWNAAVAARSVYLFEHRIRHHSGAWRTFAIRALPILNGDGAISEWVGVHTDITHQRAAEASLRERTEDLERQIGHRERAEAQLRQLNETLEERVITEIGTRRKAETALAQAQKMETLGKLTGGVAHDFNNLLQVVSGNLQLLARDVAGNEKAERRITNAMAGVSRGAKLASQLLAFGRRQALEPKVVNATRFVRDMDDMLRRAIGEAIEIETIVAGGLWNSFIDPVQMENAILNLAINARDAMDGRGRLTIELGNAHLDDDYARGHEEVSAGQYVMLAVSDTGCGMDPELVGKVFEPFFSTKGEGKGSGLGLSMVYGFVKQSGGHVKIYSEVGQGTTIKLYLPRALESEDVEVETAAGPVAGGTETVLVVEDDDEVRGTVVEMLSDLGYRVLKAIDAQSALIVIESGIPIDMLFTDVVMPGTLKSPELARKAKERLPDLAVLFTSGYTENSIVHGGRLDAGVELLSKPYTREALARKFRQVLASQQQHVKASADALIEVTGIDAARIDVAGARLTVLLVEDDAMIRQPTAEALQAAGFLVVEAASAEEAMAALQTAPIDALVTDVNLPGASGIELAERARELRPEAGIIYASGDVDALASAKGDRVEPLSKPYRAADLLATIRRVCGLAPAVEPTLRLRTDGEVDRNTE